MAKKQRVSFVEGILLVEYPTLGKTFRFDPASVSAAMRAEAERHGWKQKFGDAESGGTAAEKFAMVQRIAENLKQDQWELTGTPDLTPIICEAVSRIKKLPLAKILVAAQTAPEQVKQWGANPKVRAAILKIRAERAAKIADESDDELEIELG